MEATVFLWRGLIAFIAVAFAVDFFFFQRDGSRRQNVMRTGWADPNLRRSAARGLVFP